MFAVIIYGQLHTGTKPSAKDLKTFYGCESVVDDWDGTTPLADGALAITSLQPPFDIKGAAAIHINIAADHMASTGVLS